MNVAEVFVDRLEAMDVKQVYGLIGTSILDFIDALKDSKIRYISTRQDQAAVSMAVAEGKTSGRPGVAAIHGGPGFLNALTAVAVAQKDSVPVVMITGAVKRRMKGLDSWLEVDQESIAKSIVKSFLRVQKPSEAFEIIDRAFRISRSLPKGPVIVECAEDMWHLDAIASTQISKAIETDSAKLGEPDISRVLELMKNSKAPIILAGGGLNNERGANLLEQLVARFKLPVVTTGNGRGTLSETSESSLGRTGFGGGSTLADSCLKDSDFVLALGAGLSDVSTYAYNFVPRAEIVTISLDSLASKKPVPYSLLLNVDVVSFLEALLEQSRAFEYFIPQDWNRKIEEERKNWNALLDDAVSRKYEGYVNSSAFFRALDRRLSNDTIIAAGQGLHVLYAHSFMKVRRHSSFLAATNLGAMGYAFPASLGAKTVFPEREVIAVLGDGEFLMSMSDLETAARERLGVKVVVVNDNSYRVLLVRQKLQKMGRVHGTILGNPDFAKLGEAFGVPSMTISHDDKIENAIKFILEESDMPHILELKISPDDLPPLNMEASIRF